MLVQSKIPGCITSKAVASSLRCLSREKDCNTSKFSIYNKVIRQKKGRINPVKIFSKFDKLHQSMNPFVKIDLAETFIQSQTQDSLRLKNTIPALSNYRNLYVTTKEDKFSCADGNKDKITPNTQYFHERIRIRSTHVGNVWNMIDKTSEDFKNNKVVKPQVPPPLPPTSSKYYSNRRKST